MSNREGPSPNDVLVTVFAADGTGLDAVGGDHLDSLLGSVLIFLTAWSRTVDGCDQGRITVRYRVHRG
jgi:hypothetical protein